MLSQEREIMMIISMFQDDIVFICKEFMFFVGQACLLEAKCKVSPPL